MQYRIALVAGIWAALSTPGLALDVGRGEFHIISRDSYGYFVKSHQIYHAKQRGTVNVNYCGRDYFAYPDTVRWTEYEDENGRRVAVEFGDGKSWELVCRDPQDQVHFADIQAKLYGPAGWKGPKWLAKRHDRTRSFHQPN